MAALLLFVLGVAHADDSETFYEEQGNLRRGSQGVSALDAQLFGESMDLYTGALQFHQVDVSLPGNNALPVSVGRKYSAGRPLTLGGNFNNWDLDIPHLYGNFSTKYGWVAWQNTAARCSQYGPPGSVLSSNNKQSWAPENYWSGNFLSAPGADGEEIMTRSSSNTAAPADGNAYPLVTRSNWQIRCLPNLANGAGEGFVALSPDGTQYRFDWMVSRYLRPMSKSSSYLLRSEVWIMPTEVRDRFGNTVTYTWDPANPWKLNKIEASDGRRITIQYRPDSTLVISSVSDGTRTWTYDYSGGQLTTVTQPDGSQWHFDLKPLTVTNFILGDGGSCNFAGDYPTLPYTGTITHPSGAVGSFTTRYIQHTRSGAPYSCLALADHGIGGDYPTYAVHPSDWYTQALESKTVSGPGVDPQTWSYAWVYGETNDPNCCSGAKNVYITDPSGLVTRYTYGITFNVNEGQQLRVEEGWKNSTALRTATLHYAPASGMPYPELIGESDVLAVDPMSVVHRPVDRKEIVVQGTSFAWQANSFDAFARATDVTKTGPGGTRSETSVYADFPGIWVLGQLASTASGGLTMVSNGYDSATARLLNVTQYGVLQQSMTYHADGTLATRTDGRGNVTRFDSYKRGLPQAVSYADQTSESASVNDIGLIDSVTSLAGYTTSFSYDAAGRLSGITPPAGWTATNVDFEPVGFNEYGVPAGHWRQMITHGNAKTATYFDAYLRPVMQRTFDQNDEMNTRTVVVRGYDASGRLAYESYPQRDIASVTDRPAGKRTSYDDLSRPKLIQADSELGALNTSIEYLSGFQTRTTNARGKVTTQGFWALSDPGEAKLATVAAPAGVNLSISRDRFGKPLSIRRWGSYNGYSADVTRSYVYDAAQRLCKTVEPEVGSTLQDYDAAGNIAWRAPGQALPSLSTCDAASVPVAAKIVHQYDARNRLTDTSYGDGSPSVGRTYKPDGLPSTVTSNGTVWTYDYNSLRKLSKETLSYAGKTYELNWAFDAQGNLSSLVYPGSAPVVTFSPNALGQSRGVSGYASSIAYHPNGSVAAYNLANGIAHSLTQNLRGLPDVNKDAGVLSDKYTYDENGNVTGITDQQEGVFSRALGYDDLDRLTAANAPGVWGNASYSYDPVDNLRVSNVGSRTATRQYDARNRMSGITGTETIAYAYDANGNITTRGPQQYLFDLGNRLSQAPGKASYVYDGDGRRVFINRANGSSQLQMYSHAGQLMYAVNTGTTAAAVITDYSCPAGATRSGTTCVTTTQSAATVSGYSCPAGYTLSGTDCTKTAGSSVPATVTGYSCPAGTTLSGTTCQSTSVQPAGISSYSCPGGYTWTGSICSLTTTTTGPATPGCPAGQTLNGTTCTGTTVVAATPVYTCANYGPDYTLSGTNCSGPAYNTATSTPGTDCKGQGTLKSDGSCLNRLIYAGPGSDPAPLQCMDLASNYGLVQVNLVATTPANYYRCYIGPAPIYSCPAGQTLTPGNLCQYTRVVPASLNNYTCPSGTLSGSNCIVPTSSAATYSCPSGQTLTGSSCSQTTTSTQAGTPVYSCPGGYTLSGSSCSIATSSAATPVYGCSTGYTLSGTTCSTTTTTTIAATPVYSCGAGGTLSGTTCSYTTSSAATPVYGCPNGGTLSGGNTCTGVGGANSTTAYVYLGGKLIAEHDSVAGVLYSHTDALGSPVARTNAQGGIVAKTRFEAYGGVAQGFTPTGPNSIGFTGHVNDADTLLVYMQQRYYDPVAGRFMSVDPVVTDGATGRSFARYEYGNSNPYGFVDPNGMDSDEPPTGSHLKDGPACEINCQSSAGIKISGEKVDGPATSDMAAAAPSAAAGAPARAPSKLPDPTPALLFIVDKIDDFTKSDIGRAIEGLGPYGGTEEKWLLGGVKSVLLVAAEARAIAGPVFKTTKEATVAAEALGFKRIKETVSGQAVFQRGKTFISRDVDGHNGGAWKMADSVKNLGSRDTRTGTFSADLKTKIGD